jgi:hypothetical protein
MSHPRVLILRAPGSNCDGELHDEGPFSALGTLAESILALSATVNEANGDDVQYLSHILKRRPLGRATLSAVSSTVAKHREDCHE